MSDRLSLAVGGFWVVWDGNTERCVGLWLGSVCGRHTGMTSPSSEGVDFDDPEQALAWLQAAAARSPGLVERLEAAHAAEVMADYAHEVSVDQRASRSGDDGTVTGPSSEGVDFDDPEQALAWLQAAAARSPGLVEKLEAVHIAEVMADYAHEDPVDPQNSGTDS